MRRANKPDLAPIAYERGPEIDHAYAQLGSALTMSENDGGDDNNRRASLHAALEAWRLHPLPHISILIEKLSEHIHENDKPIGEQSGEGRERSWNEIAARADPDELGRLLKTPWPNLWSAALERVHALDRFPPDPRIAMAYVRVLDEMPFTSGLAYRFWSAIVQRLARMTDPRAEKALAEVSAKPPPQSHPRRWQSLLKRTHTAMAKAVAALARTSPLDQDVANATEEIVVAAIARLDAIPLASRAKAKGEAEFLAEIWEDPSDVGLREVYCDWLLERDDPRGEFMRLQLERAHGKADKTGKREAELFKQLQRRLCGTLGPFARCTLSDFTRGFLARGLFEMRDEQIPATFGLGEWSTLEEIELRSVPAHMRGSQTSAATIERLISKSPMRSLRSIHGLHPEAAKVLCVNRSLPTAVDEISILCDPYDDSAGGIAICRALELPPQLKRVGILSLSHVGFDWLFEAPMWRAASHLRLRCFGILAHDELPRILSACRPNLKSFELSGFCWAFRKLGGWGIEYTRDDAGNFSRLRIDWGPLQARDRASAEIGELGTLLERIPADLPREIVFKIAMPRLHMIGRAAIEKQLARFHRLETCVRPWQLT